MLRSVGLPNTARRWWVYLGDDLFACQPIAEAINAVGGNFILTCKPTSHQTIAEYLEGADLSEHRETVSKRGKRTTTIYRWLSAIPLRATDDALPVNWFSIEIRNHTGKRTYYNSFITDLPVTADRVAELAACGRARCRVGGDVAIPTPHSAGRADFPHPVPHGRASLTAAYG